MRLKLSQIWSRWSGDKPPLPEQFTKPGSGEFAEVAPYYDRLMSAVPYKSWVDYAEALLQRHNRQPRRVLDLACGTGRVGSELIRRGYQVFGADLSEPMVRYCRTQNPPLPAATMDACQLALTSQSLDSVVSLYDSLNYILDPPALQSCFAGVWRSLADEGIFIFDLNTALALRAGLFTQDNLRGRDPLKYSWKSHWYPDREICRIDMWFRWEGSGGPHEFEEVHYERAYSESEVKHMLAAAGFSAITAYNGYTFKPPTARSDRIFYVAEK